MYEVTNLLVRLCNISDENCRLPGSDMSLAVSERGEKLENKLANLSKRPESPNESVVGYISNGNSNPIDLICKGSDAEEMKIIRSGNFVQWNSSHIVSQVTRNHPSLTEKAKFSCSEWPKPFLINSLEYKTLWCVFMVMCILVRIIVYP